MEKEIDYKIKIVNVVSTCHLGKELDLFKLAKKLKSEMEYFPETMPSCAAFKGQKLKGHIRIWKNGVIVLYTHNIFDIEKDLTETLESISKFEEIGDFPKEL